MGFFYLVITMSLIWVMPAFGFTLAGSSDGEGWGAKELKIKLNSTDCPAGMESTIDEAMAVWNSVSTANIKLVREGTSTTTGSALYNGTATDSPVIVCDATFGTTFGSLSGIDPDFVAGIGGGSSSTGSKLDYGFVILNVQPDVGGNISYGSKESQKAVITHELGHMLGLGHSADTKAIMYYSTGGKTNLHLAQDDIDGLTYLYPRNELGQDALFGCGLVKAIGRSGLGSGTLSLLFFALFFPLLLIGLIKHRHKLRFDPIV